MWTFVPPILMVQAAMQPNCADCHSAPDMAGSTLACTSPSPDIALWVTSSGKPMQRPLSWRGWTTRPWVTHLSGTISNPLTATRGAAAFISSLPVIPANHSHLPDAAKAQPTPGTSGPMSRALLMKSRQNGSSPRTSKVTCHWDLPTSPATFAAWAIAQKRDCSRRLRLAVATGVAASSSWPTPTACDAGHFPDLLICNGTIKAVKASDITEASGGQIPLQNAARCWTVVWLMLRAVGWMPGGSPSLHPVRVNLRHGSDSSMASLIANPRFYERIMGWPTGWTAPGEQVTGFAAWLLRSRGQISKLRSLPNGRQDDDR